MVWDSQGLRIEARNSSLQQILNDVSTATGAKVDGLGTDERVFGIYGPGQARDVLADAPARLRIQRHDGRRSGPGNPAANSAQLSPSRTVASRDNRQSGQLRR